jgi:tetratricopeptide (TPR) repeat protein
MVQDDRSTAATIATEKAERTYGKKMDHEPRIAGSHTSSIKLEHPMFSITPPFEQCDELHKLTQLLEITIRSFGPWDLRVGSAFCTLGNIYTNMGMLPEALTMFEKDLQITRHCFHDSDLRVAGAKYNVGMTSCKVGRYPQALAYLEDALRTRIAAHGPTHPDVADVLTCIGGVYSYTARYEEALKKYEEATAIRRATLGPTDATVALSLQNLAYLRACLGQTEKVRCPDTAQTRHFGQKDSAMSAIFPLHLSLVSGKSFRALFRPLNSRSSHPPRGGCRRWRNATRRT